MTLSKQLILLISLIFLAIFSINFFTSMSNIREYLQVESEIHAQDTATSLGLSLSPYILDEDDTILETMINAIFDRGYYQEILLTNRKDQELVRKTNPQTFQEVPDWFTQLLPMETVTAVSEIDAGWVRGGTLYVTIHPGIGYLKLWQQAKSSFSYSAITFIIFVIVLVLLLHYILKPLTRIAKLALDIADGNFRQIQPLPWTTEIKQVSLSINSMSSKIQQVIQNLNNRLEETSRKLSIDGLTGLEMKATLDTDIKQHFIDNREGYLLVIKIPELAEFAKLNNAQKVDQFIQAFAEALTNTANEFQYECKAYRIVGSEFALIADCQNQQTAETLCENLIILLHELGKSFGKENVVNIGGVHFDPHGTPGSMLASANEAYEKACLIDANSYAISQQNTSAHDTDQWQRIVKHTIENENLDIDFTASAYSLTDESRLVIEECVAKVFDQEGANLPIGTFVSIAEKIGHIIDFDMLVIQQVIHHIREQKIDHDIAINLSFSTLASNEFRSRLYAVLNEHQDITGKMVFSVSAYSAAKDLGVFASFIDFCHRNDAKVILKRYEPRFVSMDQVKQLKLDYLRIARIYTENIHGDEEKRSFVSAIKELGTLLNIQVIAEAVEADQDLQVVSEIGLPAASR